MNRFEPSPERPAKSGPNPDWQRIGDAVAALETQAALWLEQLLDGIPYDPPPGPQARQVLGWIEQDLLPRVRQTPAEIEQLLQGLAGGHISSGPSGAPTRGRLEVLPTGRNFYSVDTRGIPTETAWRIGSRAAEQVIERYVQEEGEYPRRLGLSVWGTATMRTGGDDWAEALALLGVRPVWQGSGRRVVDIEVLPLEALGRPRVDVTLRISGFFRDAFPNLISLFDRAVQVVADLQEDPKANPLRAKSEQETQHWQQQGFSPAQAQRRSRLRIFGSKPGAYGAGLQGLIESQHWTSDQDLARAYLHWSGYAYTGAGDGQAAPDCLARQLRDLQIVLHNQDNREHDLLDSDDYYQFQGGLIAAVRTLSGQDPRAYFGDHSRPDNLKIRSLGQEIDRVYRSRVVNPKWIRGVMRHGYKGAFELAATVDYLFAYDVTAHCVPDFMYEGVARAYLLDPDVHAFGMAHNPWAMRDMGERLLEAHQRGSWATADPTVLAEIETLMLAAEAVVEQKT